MSLTLDELKLCKQALDDHTYNYIVDDECMCNHCKAWRILEREIKLKTTDFVRMVDVQGNPITGP